MIKLSRIFIVTIENCEYVFLIWHVHIYYTDDRVLLNPLAIAKFLNMQYFNIYEFQNIYIQVFVCFKIYGKKHERLTGIKYIVEPFD